MVRVETPTDPAEGDRNVPTYVEQSNGKEMLVWNGAALSTAEDGSLAGADHGFYTSDTRMLSGHNLTVEGHPLTLLSRIRAQNQSGSWTYRNPEIEGTLAEGALLFTLERRIDGVLHEDLRVESYAQRPARVRLRLSLDTDFADSFEVKEGHIRARAIGRRAHPAGLDLSYRRGDFARALQVRATAASEPVCDESGITFDLEIRPGAEWSYCLTYTPVIDGRAPTPLANPHPASRPQAGPRQMTTLEGQHPLALAFDQGRRDLEALAMSHNGGKPFVAAGVPWFLAVFGRDMLMTSLMSGLALPWAAEGALETLARLQATVVDDSHDAEPGKLVHELRLGEKAHFSEILQTPYYGGHDIPALYCLALWQAWRWTGDQTLLTRYMPHALAALQWCDEYGDRDRDGLLEYATRANDGYYNQSWKDAEEAIVDGRGVKVPLPLATVEMQGYWYAARLAMAELLRVVGDTEAAAVQERAADQLREAVEERYWLPNERCYALALDREKRPVRAVGSNPGHLLWCGLPSPERAATLADRLLEPDMFSGWGLRTLSSQNPSFNPVSYQNGSVWPHDTALAAAGMSRYGLHAQAARLMKGLIDASARMPEHRLPELLAGSDRASHFLTPHPEANSPQAWGSSTALLLAQVLLGVVPDAPHGRCTLMPVLPEWLPSLAVRNVRVGTGQFSARVVRRGETTEVEELTFEGVEVITGARPASDPLWGAPRPQ